MKLTADELNAAARSNDVSPGIKELDKWLEARGVDPEALMHLALQRAMRAAAIIIDGMTPEQLASFAHRVVPLSSKAHEAYSSLATTFLDGFAVAFTALKKEEEKKEE